ncbi:transposase [Azospirillum lipoferum]|uniref:transposase n=1 Tax=Azospirillum lipoferum TaxID=193 RepID=UPI001395DC98
MAIQRVEVITGAEQRRQFSEEEKQRLVEEAFQPGVKATAVARQLGVDVSLPLRANEGETPAPLKFKLEGVGNSFRCHAQ